MSSEDSPKKEEGLPPGQAPIKRLLRWGIDHPGVMKENPKIDLKTYTLTVDGEVQEPLRLGWDEVLKLPKAKSTSDFHCVEGWSVLNCQWEGILFREVVSLAKPKDSAGFATFECADGYTTSLSRRELSGDDVLLAYTLDGKLLEEGFGFPLRLVIPGRYGYKSALWVTHIKFTSKKELGYWEKRGYSDTADIWKNDRFTR
jgi:DMSO/TMAO reductase YedYZ molybdopterin-dependent catalytic subunit